MCRALQVCEHGCEHAFRSTLACIEPAACLPPCGTLCMNLACCVPALQQNLKDSIVVTAVGERT